jgi:hypothetical protein
VKWNNKAPTGIGLRSPASPGTSISTLARFTAVDLERQLLPGTLGHALDYLIDHELALSGDSAPHYTTIATLVSGLGDDIAKFFVQLP